MKTRFKNVSFVLAMTVVTVTAFTLSNAKKNTADSNVTLTENEAIAGVTSEAAGTCCPTDAATCVIGRVAVAYHYLLSGTGHPCP